MQQINFALARSQGVTPEGAPRIKQQILNRLIDRQLAKRQAILRALDRTPSVVQAIEAAKSEILARAYRESLVENLPGPGSTEVRSYYRGHPELFAQRRLFNLEQLAFAAESDVGAALREQLSLARSMQEIADWLQSRGVKFVAGRGVRSAEQIPLEILSRLHAMKEGEMQLFDAGSGRLQLIRVVSYKTEPVEEASAAPRIEQFLFNRRSNEVVVQETKRIREQAKIEYFGDFAAGAVAAQAEAEADAEIHPGTRKAPNGQARE